eukprot:CAMPEP_0196823510 /NCGR_PEP_ID=MMETSP1362-20130617/87800_1 /TAXON_ID=163516 /ORGANISM="Leptocylindrus danicus, Strain CCMP1856" /LENGTH=201 /DNA_ID=CAMNT_0042203399 /DNA_START=1 /DNA_END=606 /DNA_ORIENTATION=-
MTTASNHFDKSTVNECGSNSRPEKVMPLFPWKALATSLRLMGLAGFWASDNVAFLTKNKFLLQSSPTAREAQEFGAKSYFFASWMGLFIAANDLNSQRIELKRLESEVDELSSSEEKRTSPGQELSDALHALEKGKADQFVNLLTLIKGVVDVMVFSNNAGVDLHQKYRGKKMNEGVHSMCGLVSAFVVLYKNFPNAKSTR